MLRLSVSRKQSSQSHAASMQHQRQQHPRARSAHATRTVGAASAINKTHVHDMSTSASTAEASPPTLGRRQSQRHAVARRTAQSTGAASAARGRAWANGRLCRDGTGESRGMGSGRHRLWLPGASASEANARLDGAPHCGPPPAPRAPFIQRHRVPPDGSEPGRAGLRTRPALFSGAPSFERVRVNVRPRRDCGWTGAARKDGLRVSF